jgi:hypothetical protein
MASPSPGAELETVLLGGLCQDVLRVWRGDGQAEGRKIDDPEVVARALGRGVLARTSHEPNRFREVGLLDADGDQLVLMGRATAKPGAEQITTGANTVRAHPSSTPPRDVDPWMAWGQWLGDIVLAAAARAEYVVVETGGWDAVSEPYVLLGVFPDEEGEWLSRVEAAPPPAGDPWTPPADGQTASSLLAPATRDNVSVAGILAIQAIPLWAETPLDVVLTFGRHPNGPWTPEASDAGAAAS